MVETLRHYISMGKVLLRQMWLEQQPIIQIQNLLWEDLVNLMENIWTVGLTILDFLKALPDGQVILLLLKMNIIIML